MAPGDGGREKFLHRAADDLRDGPLEHQAGKGIDILHDQIAVEDENHVVRRFGQGAVAVLAFPQGMHGMADFPFVPDPAGDIPRHDEDMPADAAEIGDRGEGDIHAEPRTSGRTRTHDVVEGLAGAQNLLEFLDIHPDDRLAKEIPDGSSDQLLGGASGGCGHRPVHRYDPENLLRFHAEEHQHVGHRIVDQAQPVLVQPQGILRRLLRRDIGEDDDSSGVFLHGGTEGRDGNIEVQGAPAGRSAGKRQIPD